jgi:DNA-binding response OmpR family regulator/DNA-binding CsgD family transcriptional regulator
MTAASELVMVIDDNLAEMKMLSNALEHAGYTVVAASGGEAALRLCAEVIPKAIILDAVMPSIDGFELCQRLKQDTRFLHVPVLFLTGLSDTEHVIHGLDAGGVDYVTKPVILSELIARIRVHISNARIAQGTRVALDVTGRHLLAVDSQGRLLWSTPQAAALLRQSLGLPEKGLELPNSVVWRFADLIAAGVSPASILTVGGVTVSFLCEAGPDEYLFRLTPFSGPLETSPLQLELGLTIREAEVLLWISRGKSNQDISEILAISVRTVDKHAERIFTKLGVENRSSASSIALGVLLRRL